MAALGFGIDVGSVTVGVYDISSKSEKREQREERRGREYGRQREIERRRKAE
jgi:hypothetical protein